MDVVTTTMPPSHVGTATFQPDHGGPDELEFPALNSSTNNHNSNNTSETYINSKEKISDGDWEMIPSTLEQQQQPQQKNIVQVSFDDVSEPEKKNHPKYMRHSQSSPNLRDYIIEESESEESNDDHDKQQDDDEFETVNMSVLHDDASSFTMVSGPPSVNSIWSSRISFKDALLQKSNMQQAQSINENSTTNNNTPSKHHHHHHQRIRKVKPKFVVTQVVPIKHAHSTGDLKSMAYPNNHNDDDEVMGDTDAHEYYSRKAQGSLGRKNGQKLRPDEAKRLQMTMNKKQMQRARQAKR